METRKIQATGGSSYMVTLPKQWIRQHGLGKNDPVGMVVQPGGTLLITPTLSGQRPAKEKELKVGPKDSTALLFRQLIGAYLMGASTIIVRTSHRAPPEVRECVRDFIHRTIGPEIVDETAEAITIKDLLNPGQLPLDHTVKRLVLLVQRMHEDAFTSLQDQDETLAADVLARDAEVDRLHWFVEHQYNTLMRGPVFDDRLGVTAEEATYYYLVSGIMERIGDHACRVATSGSTLDEPLERKLLNRIAKVQREAVDLFVRSAEAWNKRDVKMANDIIEAVTELSQQCDTLTRSTLLAKEPGAVGGAYVIESIRRTAEYSADISELTINYVSA